MPNFVCYITPADISHYMNLNLADALIWGMDMDARRRAQQCRLFDYSEETYCISRIALWNWRSITLMNAHSSSFGRVCIQTFPKHTHTFNKAVDHHAWLGIWMMHGWSCIFVYDIHVWVLNGRTGKHILIQSYSTSV